MNDIAYLALGSNQGDRLGYLREALQLLSQHPGITIEQKSSLYETESVEGGGDGAFLNAAIRIKTSLSPEELLEVTQQIETHLGRPAPPRQGARNIDIDILFFMGQNAASAQLQLPHPRLHYRNFVLAPLLEVLQGGAIQRTALSW